MKHIAMICPAVSGHLNPATTLGRELLRRGYRVSVIALSDAEHKVQAAGLEFIPFGEKPFPKGSMERITTELGERAGKAAVRYTIDHYSREADVLLREVPGVLRRVGADILLTDQTQPGTTAAEAVGIPCITMCYALAMDREPDIPPWMTPWPFDPTPEGRARNAAGYAVATQIIQPIRDTINAFRREKGLTEILPDTPQKREGDSRLATISQQPSFFDFPRQSLPPTFHYTGPFHDASSGEPAAFPFHRLDNRPLIYASMGTLLNKREEIFHTIALACAGLDAQLVISMGRADQPIPSDLLGAPLVVAYAPQMELLKRAALTITHSGMNTVLESLSEGVPLVAIPMANDQPAIAARIAYIGVGEIVSLGELDSNKLRAAVETVLTKPQYRAACLAARNAIAQSSGIDRAADIVEKVIISGQRVLTTDEIPRFTAIQ